MNKNELVHEIAKQADVTIADAEKCLKAFTDTVTHVLKKKDTVTLVGFGTFEVRERQERQGVFNNIGSFILLIVIVSVIAVVVGVRPDLPDLSCGVLLLVEEKLSLLLLCL